MWELSTGVLVFSGHRVDAPGRAVPRFPPSAEPLARRMIQEAVEREIARPGIAWQGLSAAASGGDILFQEICAELGLPTAVFLPVEPRAFETASVADAGGDWVERYRALLRTRPVQVLAEPAGERPAEGAAAGLSVWQRGNLWMLDEAVAAAGERATLIALWDGEAGDGPGGTADMLERARARGARAVVLDASRLAAGSDLS